MPAEMPTQIPSSALCATQQGALPACLPISDSPIDPSTPPTTQTTLDICRPLRCPAPHRCIHRMKPAPTATKAADNPPSAPGADTTSARPASDATPAKPTPKPSNSSPPSDAPTVRLACPQDLIFVDHLQKIHRDSIGFLNRSALEAYIQAGHVTLIDCNNWEAGYVIHPPNTNGITRLAQIAVHPDVLRSTLGTQLMAVVEHAARAQNQTAIRLRSRQDLDANMFWPTLGFTLTAVHTPQGRKNLPRYEWTRHLTPLIYIPPPLY